MKEVKVKDLMFFRSMTSYLKDKNISYEDSFDAMSKAWFNLMQAKDEADNQMMLLKDQIILLKNDLAAVDKQIKNNESFLMKLGDVLSSRE